MKQRDGHPWKKARLPENDCPPRPGQFGPDNQPIKGEVPVENLQAAFRKSGITKAELARRLGWTRVVPNLKRVNFALGFETQTATGKKQERVTYETALRLCRAMDADPFEVGV